MKTIRGYGVVSDFDNFLGICVVTCPEGFRFFSRAQWCSENLPTVGMSVAYSGDNELFLEFQPASKPVNQDAFSKTLERVGPHILGLYLLLVVATSFLPFVQMGVLGFTFRLSLLSGSGPMASVAVVISLLSVLPPVISEKPISWLALCIPLAMHVAAAVSYLYRPLGFWRSFAPLMTEHVHFGLGAYIGIFVAAHIAFFGLSRFRKLSAIYSK